MEKVLNEIQSDSNFGTAEEISIVEIPPPYVYSAPDGSESNPEILRAEMAFFSTPQAQMMSSDVYSALQDIQTQCSADYQSICAPSIELSNTLNAMNIIHEMLTEQFTSRRLWAAQVGPGNKIINKIRAFYTDEQKHQIAGKRILKRINRASNTLIANKMSTQRNLRVENGKEDKHDHQHKRPDHEHDGWDRSSSESDGESDSESSDSEGSGDEMSGSGNEEEDRHHHGHNFLPPPSHDHDEGSPCMEDMYYNGALGFGAQGDQCMYDNAQLLSAPCYQSIDNLYALREQYWRDYSAATQPSPAPFFAILFGISLLFVCIRRFMTRNRRKEVNKLLTGLQNDSELKSAVESKLAMSVPPPHPYYQRRLQWERQHICVRFIRFVGFVLSVFFISLFISITSLELTSVVVHGLDAQASEHGGEMTSPLFALFILLCITSLEIYFLSMGVRSLKRYFKKNCQRNNADNTDGPTSPSAPTEAQLYGGNPSPTPSGRGRQIVSSFLRRAADAGSSFFETVRTFRVSGGSSSPTSDYMVLNSQEDTEMISMHGASTHGSSRPTVVASPAVNYHSDSTPGLRYAVYTGVPVVNSSTGGNRVVAAAPVWGTHVNRPNQHPTTTYL